MIITDHPPVAPPRHGISCLNRFRTGFYSCLTRRGDTLFELADAVACGSSPVTDLARLSLEIEHHRGHGGLYDGLNAGVIDTYRLRQLTCTGPLPRITGPDGRERIVLAVDVSNWLRPDAATSPDRAFCHTYARGSGPSLRIINVAHGGRCFRNPRSLPIKRSGTICVAATRQGAHDR